MISGLDNNDLLRTKLHRPRGSADLVHRARLNRRLTEAIDRSVILIAAPAGFGKSSLVSNWLETCDLPHAWLSLDETDNDLRVFLSYFVAAVQTIYADALEETSHGLKGSMPLSLNDVASSLTNELDEIGRKFILVLDDFHRIREQAIHDLLTQLLQHPPRNMHLVIATRFEPPLPLRELRAHGKVVDIRGDDLLFTTTEIAAFVENVLGTPLSADALSVLAERTRGWAACVRLALLTLRSAPDIDVHLAELHAQNRYVTDYLMNEVLAQVPAAMRTFLLKTSILTKVCAPLARAVVGMDDPYCDPQECLSWLERASMFTEAVDLQGEWYRYHQLFHMYLEKELVRQLADEEIRELHSRASAWHADYGNLEDALRHALAGQDTRKAVCIVAQHRHHLLNTEQRARLERWLQTFSSAETSKHPDLLLAWAWCARLGRNNPQRVVELVNQAQACIAGMIDDPEYARQIQGEIDVLRSVEKGLAGNDPRGVITLATRALQAVPQEWYLARSTARLHLAAAYQMSGRIDEAYAVLATGRREQMADIDIERAREMASDGFISWIAADLSRVMQTGRNIINVGQHIDLQETIGWGHCFLAMVYYQRNILVDARQHAEAVQERRHAGDPLSITHGAFVLASIHQALSMYEEARLVLDSLNQYLRESNREALLPLVRAFGAELAARQGDLDTASQWAATVSPAGPFGVMAFFYAPQLTLPKVLLAMNTPTSRQHAAAALSRLHAYVTETRNTRFTIEVLALQALLSHAEGNAPAALQALEQALALAQPGGLIRAFADIGPGIAPLLVRLQQKPEVGVFIGQILRALDLGGARPQPIRGSGQSALIDTLTPREWDVLALLAERLTNKEIAVKLYISPRTVGRHTANLYQKLGVSNRREAVVAARSLGLL